MRKESLFIVIEGLDGSGKTTASKHLANHLQKKAGKNILRSYEPNDESCGGNFIRQALEKKITHVNPRTLLYAFAANRLDHCSRTIQPWLDKGTDHIFLCDRYYLSSLVYQSNEDIDMKEVMLVNAHAIRPDLIFFMNVDDEVCYQRMDVRNKPRELFEENLAATRDKYFKAIDFLKKERNETIIEIDANGTVENIVEQMLQALESITKLTKQN